MTSKSNPWQTPARASKPRRGPTYNRKLARIVEVLRVGGELDDEQSIWAAQVISKFIDPATGLDTISLRGKGRPQKEGKQTEATCLVQEIDWRIAEAQEGGSKRARTEVIEQVASEKGMEVETLNKIYRLATKQNADADRALAMKLRSAGSNLDEWLGLLAHQNNCPPGLLRRSYERGVRLLLKEGK